MGPRNNQKKGNKARNTAQGRQGVRRPLVTPIVAAQPAAPTTPIPALVTLTSPPELKTVRGGARTVKKWCFDRTPVYFSPDEPWPSITLNKGAIVELTGQHLSVSADELKSSWLEIAYESYDPKAGPQWVTGWVNEGYLDDYNEKFPDSGVSIPNPTPSPTDAQQYMILEGKVRYNLCGELSVAFIVGGDIESVLLKWKTNSPATYNAILAGGRDNPTSENDLKNMLCAVLGEYGFGSEADQLVSLRNTLTYPIDPVGLYTDLQKMLTTHCLIAGVTINDAGELIGKENPRIKHWVVLDKITRNGTRVEVYNPYPNKREEYTFTEFYNSCSTNSGLWVKRKKPHAAGAPEPFPTLQVQIDHPNPLYNAAQYIDVEGKKKTNLCGEFCVTFILKEPIETVLARWKEVQPILYADKVGGNKGTGTFDLRTILRAYGYNSPGDTMDFNTGMMDPVLKKYLPSPGRIAAMLENYYLIAGCNISGVTGKLKPGNDVRHWVVIDKLSPVGKNRGWVELYNPFPNSWEEYSYKEFINSAGYWSGLWVKREIVPVYVPQPVETAGVADQPGQDRIGQWTEAQLIGVLRNKLKSRKPVGKIAAEVAEMSGWKKRDVLRVLKNLMKPGQSGAWTEARLRQEIVRRLKLGKSITRISAQLADLTGWKKKQIVIIIKQVLEAQKWSEEQLIEAMRQRLKTVKSVNKIATELAAVSGWKKREIVSRLKKLIAAEKWTEPQLRAEMERRLKTAGSLNKLAIELAGLSGWSKWSISKMLKAMRNLQKKHEKKEGKVIVIEEEPIPPADAATIEKASLPLAEFEAWQQTLLAQPGTKLRQVRKWGDKVMVKYKFDVNYVNTSNFQAVGLYNDGNREFGAISNFIRISHAEVRRLAAMQIEDQYVAKVTDWRSQKMNWLCKHRGTIYFFDEKRDQWPTAPFIRWGTLALGGNLVQVEEYVTINAKLREGGTRDVEMARLKGFHKTDWGKSLDQLLSQGLVHRCFCAYKSNHFGDSPKGIVYSPFYSPQDWDFAGQKQAKNLYIPTEWLEPKKPG